MSYLTVSYDEDLSTVFVEVEYSTASGELQTFVLSEWMEQMYHEMTSWNNNWYTNYWVKYFNTS